MGNRDKLLARNYYEYDNAFYTKKANISCWEQMLYQSLRDYDVDYFLIFCNDINVKLWKIGEKWNVYQNDLGYNEELSSFVVATTLASEAEKK